MTDNPVADQIVGIATTPETVDVLAELLALHLDRIERGALCAAADRVAAEWLAA